MGIDLSDALPPEFENPTHSERAYKVALYYLEAKCALDDAEASNRWLAIAFGGACLIIAGLLWLLIQAKVSV